MATCGAGRLVCVCCGTAESWAHDGRCPPRWLGARSPVCGVPQDRPRVDGRAVVAVVEGSPGDGERAGSWAIPGHSVAGAMPPIFAVARSTNVAGPGSDESIVCKSGRNNRRLGAPARCRRSFLQFPRRVGGLVFPFDMGPGFDSFHRGLRRVRWRLVFWGVDRVGGLGEGAECLQDLLHLCLGVFPLDGRSFLGFAPLLSLPSRRDRQPRFSACQGHRARRPPSGSSPDPLASLFGGGRPGWRPW